MTKYDTQILAINAQVAVKAAEETFKAGFNAAMSGLYATLGVVNFVDYTQFTRAAFLTWAGAITLADAQPATFR